MEILKTLVRIPSISFPDFDTKEVVRSADAVAEVFKNIGLIVGAKRRGVVGVKIPVLRHHVGGAID